MPSMHLSAFIRPNDTIHATGVTLEHGGGCVTVRIVGDGESSEIAVFADLARLLEFGQAIVREVEAIMPRDGQIDLSPYAYAINDAVEHDAAMAAADEAKLDENPF